MFRSETKFGISVFPRLQGAYFSEPAVKLWEGTLPETNSSHLKMDVWNTSFLLGRPIFRCYVSFRECTFSQGILYLDNFSENYFVDLRIFFQMDASTSQDETRPPVNVQAELTEFGLKREMKTTSCESCEHRNGST